LLGSNGISLHVTCARASVEKTADSTSTTASNSNWIARLIKQAKADPFP